MSAAHTERSRVRVGPRHGLETASLHVAKHSGSDMPAICLGGCSCLQAVAVGGCAPARLQPHAKQSKQPERLRLCRHMLQVSCTTHWSHKLKEPESEKAPGDYALQSAPRRSAVPCAKHCVRAWSSCGSHPNNTLDGICSFWPHACCVSVRSSAGPTCKAGSLVIPRSLGRIALLGRAGHPSGAPAGPAT